MDTHKRLFYEKLDQYYIVNKNAKKPWNYDEIKEVNIEVLFNVFL